MEVAPLVRVCIKWYVEPSTVSLLPPILQVTLVAGPSVEMQVSDLVVALNVSSEILGMPGEIGEKQVDSTNSLDQSSLEIEVENGFHAVLRKSTFKGIELQSHCKQNMGDLS